MRSMRHCSATISRCLAELVFIIDRSGSMHGLDAVGDAIKHIGNIHKYSRKSDVPEKTLFVIITDGMENASHKYSAAQIKEMINRLGRMI